MKKLLLASLRDARWEAECGVISKEIKRIFQRVGEINDENQKKNRAQNADLRILSLDFSLKASFCFL